MVEAEERINIITTKENQLPPVNHPLSNHPQLSLLLIFKRLQVHQLELLHLWIWFLLFLVVLDHRIILDRVQCLWVIINNNNNNNILDRLRLQWQDMDMVKRFYNHKLDKDHPHHHQINIKINIKIKEIDNPTTIYTISQIQILSVNIVNL